MTSEEFFNKYYYLVERFTERYSLDEDGSQELALYFGSASRAIQVLLLLLRILVAASSPKQATMWSRLCSKMM